MGASLRKRIVEKEKNKSSGKERLVGEFTVEELKPTIDTKENIYNTNDETYVCMSGEQFTLSDMSHQMS